jgi:hypothetical protein
MMDAGERENERQIELCHRLAAATDTAAAAVSWELDGRDRFVWRQSEGAVAIASRDADGQPPYQLSVYNGDRLLVDELSSLLLAGDRPARWNEPLAGLYRAARRSALHADDLLETLIALVPRRSGEEALTEIR